MPPSPCWLATAVTTYALVISRAIAGIGHRDRRQRAPRACGSWRTSVPWFCRGRANASPGGGSPRAGRPVTFYGHRGHPRCIVDRSGRSRCARSSPSWPLLIVMVVVLVLATRQTRHDVEAVRSVTFALPGDVAPRPFDAAAATRLAERLCGAGRPAAAPRRRAARGGGEGRRLGGGPGAGDRRLPHRGQPARRRRRAARRVGRPSPIRTARRPGACSPPARPRPAPPAAARPARSEGCATSCRRCSSRTRSSCSRPSTTERQGSGVRAPGTEHRKTWSVLGGPSRRRHESDQRRRPGMLVVTTSPAPNASSSRATWARNRLTPSVRSTATGRPQVRRRRRAGAVRDEDDRVERPPVLDHHTGDQKAGGAGAEVAALHPCHGRPPPPRAAREVAPRRGQVGEPAPDHVRHRLPARTPGRGWR